MALPKLRTQFGIDPAAAEQNALKTMAGRAGNVLAQKKLAAFDVDRQNMLADRSYQISRRPVLEASQGLAVLRQLAPGMDMNMYLSNRDMIMQATGLPEVFLPTAEQIQANAAEYSETPEQSFENLKAAWSGKEAPEAEEPEAPGWSAPKEGIDNSGNPIVYRVNKQTGEPQIIKGVRPKSKRGLRVFDPKTGALLVDTTGGQGGTADMTKKTQGTIEEKIMGAREARIRAENIVAQINDEFLTIPGKLKGWGLNLKDKLGWSLNPEQQAYVDQISTFTQDAIENINLYIKELTGAQMSEAEANRLRQAMADAGDNIWSGDGPRKFRSKIKNTIRKAKLAEARWTLLRERGFDFDPTEQNLNRMENRYSYAKVEQMLRNRATEIGQQIEMSNPGMAEEDIMKETRRQMRERYNI